MISVCMATCNGEKYVQKQVESILAQLSETDEVIVSDDSSSDATIKIIESFNDSRIKIFKQQKFCSPIFNFENAIKNATGDYIFLSDQDDLWLPNKVKITVNYLKKYDCVISDAFIIDMNEKIISDSFFEVNKSKKGLCSNFIKNGYLGCCMAFHKKMLKYILPFPDNIPMHDMWIGSVSELFGQTVFCKEPLIYHRRHGLNYSMTSEKSINPIAVRLKYRLNLFSSLAGRLFERVFFKQR